MGGLVNRNIYNNQSVIFTFDGTTGDIEDGMIGYGKYRINIYKLVGSNFTLVNHCYVDYSHSLYPWSPPPNGLANDISITYINENTLNHWGYPMPPDNTVKIWDQRVRVPEAYEEQDKNGFKSAVPDSYGNWLQWPLDPLNFNGSGMDIGKLMVNLDIIPNHHPKVKCGETFSIESGSRLLLQSTNNGANYSQFTVGEYPGSNCCAC